MPIYSYRSFNFVFAAATSQQVLTGNGARLAIVFDFAQGGICWFGNRPLDTTFQGVFSVVVNQPFMLLWKDVGELVRAEWHAIPNGAGAILNVTEVFKM